ncbi:MAG: GNAT family N-acetyltransferase [Actinomycetota bacterium]|nr:GNAT family N-acetyltransferase [Actinomycetota bacterium]
MIAVRRAETDADLEAWIEVRRAVQPNESAGTVEDLRIREKPERLLLVAELDGGLAGSGLTGRSDTGDRIFVALAGGEIVGYSGLMRHDNPGVAEDGLTVVRRDWRRRGLALALKRLELAWAAENGFREVVTWTQRGNEGMRRLNERLGYDYRGLAANMYAPPPLPLDSGRS